MPEVMLEAENVTKSFRGLRALHRVSLRLHRGEVLGLIGPNGAGKTTLVNVLSGFVRPESGVIRLEGQDVTSYHPERICRLGLARTFQIPKPLLSLTVIENIMVGAFTRTRSPRVARASAVQIASEVELGGALDLPASALTLVERKRLELARALATEPKVVLLDEFFAGLNPAEVARAIDIVRALVGRGLAFLVVEHNMRVIAALAERLVVLNFGSKIAEGATADVLRNPEVVQAYLGRGAG